jgi:hypothetical protein
VRKKVESFESVLESGDVLRAGTELAGILGGPGQIITTPEETRFETGGGLCKEPCCAWLAASK